MPSRRGDAASNTDVEAPCSGVLRRSGGVLRPPVYFCSPVAIAPGWSVLERMPTLRSSPHPIGALNEMVLAQGLGDEDRQAPRAEKGDCGLSASIGRDHAPHLG